MAGTPDTRPGGGVDYNPAEHQGLLYALGRQIIVANASQAKLHELPEEVRKELAQGTAVQLALMNFSRGEGGVMLEITDEKRASELESGYKKGLKILGY